MIIQEGWHKWPTYKNLRPSAFGLPANSGHGTPGLPNNFTVSRKIAILQMSPLAILWTSSSSKHFLCNGDPKSHSNWRSWPSCFLLAWQQLDQRRSSFRFQRYLNFNSYHRRICNVNIYWYVRPVLYLLLYLILTPRKAQGLVFGEQFNFCNLMRRHMLCRLMLSIKDLRQYSTLRRRQDTNSSKNYFNLLD